MLINSTVRGLIACEWLQSMPESLSRYQRTRTDARVDSAMIAALSPQFSDDAIIELTGLFAFQNMFGKFNTALGVPPQGFCRIPDSGNKPDLNAQA